MPQIKRSAIVAAAAVATGGALYGAAAGGMVGIDRDLQAAAAPPARIQTVEFHPVSEPVWERSRECDEGRVRA
jgi:hypothetical protein